MNGNQELENQEELEQQPEQTEEVTQDNLSDLANLTEEDLAKYNNYGEYLESLNQTEPTEPVNETNDTTESTNQSNSEEETIEQVQEMSDADFRQFVTSQFRANHKDVQVTDPNDIRKLMQYGMNFHKKMAELAPHRKILKALEKNGLTNESKVNFLIDLANGDKSAIAQFLKDKEIDIYDLPDLEEQPYQAQNHIPDDHRVQFDEVIDSLNQSQYGQRTLSFMKDLDDNSFQDIYENPVIAQNLAIHAETGLMDDAISLLEREYALGKVPQGVKYIDAYAYVAQHLEKENPDKYLPSFVKSQPQRVVGTNAGRNTQPVQQQPTAKTRAGIPNNSQVNQQQSQSYSGIDALLNASAEDLAKYNNWEEYLSANNINFQR